MSAILIERGPFCEPFSLQDAMDYVHATSHDDDVLLTSLITAARERCELFTRRSFINKDYVQYLDSFPYFTDTIMSQQAFPPSYYSLPRYSTSLWNYSQMIKLMASPMASVSHITYISSADGRPKALLVGYPMWFPLDDVPVGLKMVDSNGNVQSVKAAGKTGSVEPTWATAANAVTSDGSAVWSCDGVVAPDAMFVADAASEPPRIFPRSGQYWPSVMYTPNAVGIHFTAGYNDDVAIAAAVATYQTSTSPSPTAQQVSDYEAGLRRADVPQMAVTAMKQLLAHWYDNRWGVMSEVLKTVPAGFEMLLWGLRVFDQAPTRG